jgi:hypothetical protein
MHWYNVEVIKLHSKEDKKSRRVLFFSNYSWTLGSNEKCVKVVRGYKVE